ncbi:MAG: hypothetical protein H6Q55_3762 [Deltaproteobacteria bacterium]|jgi:hypothetical protein|nr:hypothetical protein [Deltaproteobacteria bacterium]
MQNEIIGLKDIHAAAYLEYAGIPLTLTRVGTRVVFEVPNDDRSLRLLAEFQCNPAIPIQDYVNVLRRLRGRMLDVRDGRIHDGYEEGNGNGKISPR